MKPLIALAFLSIYPCMIHAAWTVNYSYDINAPIPDNSGVGLSDTQHVTTAITSISEVNVQLAMSGGWSGDLYAYLRHGSGFAVLLNRPGRSLNELLGSGTNDLSVVFADNALSDIHTGIPSLGTVSGLFQPDAREIDPDNALDTSPRTAFLSSFEGLDANDDWILYVADVATGDTMIFEGWTLTITGVPEPTQVALGLLGGLLLMRRRR
jgi:subtilisin-like proprotein convertase family protein